MQREIKKIEIVLENCEVITVDGEYIGDFSCDDIKHSIHRMGCNYIGESLVCKDFLMSIHRDCALNDTQEFIMGSLNEKRNPLQRINNYRDITSIYIHFTDEKKEPKQIYVKWNDDCEWSNYYQKTHINQFGDLFIVVSKDLKFADVFDMEEIEDKESIDFMWEMYS